MNKLLGVGGVAILIGVALSPYNPLLMLSPDRLPVFFLSVTCAALALYATYLHLQVRRLTEEKKSLAEDAEAARQECFNAKEDLRIWQQSLTGQHLTERAGGITPKGDRIEHDPDGTEDEDRKRITRSLSRDKIAAALSSLEVES